jgi:hypothetical protein
MKVNDIDLIKTNLEHCFRYPTPPTGVAWHKAKDEDLRRHGLPHRPDPKKHPAGARTWLHAMSKIKRFVSPKLSLRSKIVHGVPQKIVNRARPHNEGGPVNQNTSSNWSGLISANFPPYTQVWANWVVPAIQVPNDGGGDYYSSLWVGLNDTSQQSLFQAGTEHETIEEKLGVIDIKRVHNYYAWMEWFPGPEIALDGSDDEQSFPVSPGQAISVSLDAIGNTGGVIIMVNLASGVATTPIFLSAPTSDFNGNPIAPPAMPNEQAVWILERPGLGADSHLSVLADYGEAMMSMAGAVGSNVRGTSGKGNQIAVGQNDQGQLIDMTANDGVTILSVAAEAPGLTFTFLGGDQA